MPQRRQPKPLREACIASIINQVDTYWLPEKSQARAQLDPFYSNTHFRYLISPFHHLNDATVDLILRSLYKQNRLNRYHLLVFIQSRLRVLDLSFIKKKNLVGPSLAYYLGRNCFSLVELNLFAQTDLTPKSLSYILQWLKQLKKLDISHTKANLYVFETIGIHCLKIESLYADNCAAIYDACLDVVSSKLSETITEISMDNVRLGKESIKQTLLKCARLKHFYANGLLNVITEMFESDCESFKLLRFFIDSDITLNTEKMEALVRASPELRQLNINCISSNNCLAYLGQFHALNELLLANTASLISFRFGGVFLDALRESLGRQLKSIHLIHLVDVNLRSLAKHCPNLVKLNVEFLGYYEPAFDYSILDEDSLMPIKSLRHLSISNVIPKLDQIPMNMGQFQKDLTGLVSNGRLKYLHISGMNELADDFFECLFLAPVLDEFPNNFAYESIETIELRDLSGITGKMVYHFLIDRPNHLRELNLHGCKQISRSDLKRFQTAAVLRNLDLNVSWT